MPAKKLTHTHVRWTPSKSIEKLVKSPKSIAPTQAIIGQKRAVEALNLGLHLYQPGYNIFVAGMAGSGRTTTIRRALSHLKPSNKLAPDRCYVYNFVEPSQPLLLNFERGKGKAFTNDMKELVNILRKEIPKTIESPHIQRERELIVDRYQRDEKKMFEEFAGGLKKQGFALIQVQEGGYVSPTVFPIIGKEAVSIDYLDTLVREEKITEDERDEKIKRHKELSVQLKRVLINARNLGRDMHKALDRLIQRSASVVLDSTMDDLQTRYPDKKVRKYLLRAKSHILENIESFSDKKQETPGLMGNSEGGGEGMIILGGAGSQKQEDPFWYYEVNLLFDSSNETTTDEKMPIIEESNPSYTNLFGAIEYNYAHGGFWSTDFRHIKAGSLLKADGGYLIINAIDVLRRPMVWDQLKRILRTEKLVIQQPESHYQIAPLTIKPEPIDLNIKVIMIGSEWMYHVLFQYEEDFAKTFKVLADFGSSMPLSTEAAKQYLSVLKAVGERGNIREFSSDGLVALLEYGIEDAGQQDRISTKFAYITDILREADYWAMQDKSNRIDRKHVRKALDAKNDRHGLTEEHIQRMIDDGILLIDCKGKRVGQINGLSVYSMGHTSFGKPSRLTVTTSIGNSGIVNIEREAKLSGPIHDKGVLVLSGFLRHKYAQKATLNLNASICFEQNYGGVDGDSASSTEIYALLSAISGLPINQQIAVTGSVNQFGDIQPIGGANEKIAGFFDVCKAKRLTGSQGVIIPVQNERHLMLRPDIVDAIKAGKFHIYSVKTIDEGLELLLGKTAGKPNKNGNYPKDSIHGIVIARLEEMTQLLHQEEDEEDEKSTDKKDSKKKDSKKVTKKKKVVRKKKK